MLLFETEIGIHAQPENVWSPQHPNEFNAVIVSNLFLISTRFSARGQLRALSSTPPPPTLWDYYNYFRHRYANAVQRHEIPTQNAYTYIHMPSRVSIIYIFFYSFSTIRRRRRPPRRHGFPHIPHRSSINPLPPPAMF